MTLHQAINGNGHSSPRHFSGLRRQGFNCSNSYNGFLCCMYIFIAHCEALEGVKRLASLGENRILSMFCLHKNSTQLASKSQPSQWISPLFAVVQGFRSAVVAFCNVELCFSMVTSSTICSFSACSQSVTQARKTYIQNYILITQYTSRKLTQEPREVSHYCIVLASRVLVLVHLSCRVVCSWKQIGLSQWMQLGSMQL